MRRQDVAKNYYFIFATFCTRCCSSRPKAVLIFSSCNDMDSNPPEGSDQCIKLRLMRRPAWTGSFHGANRRCCVCRYRSFHRRTGQSRHGVPCFIINAACRKNQISDRGLNTGKAIARARVSLFIISQVILAGFTCRKMPAMYGRRTVAQLLIECIKKSGVFLG